MHWKIWWFTAAYSQDAAKYYEQGLEKARAGKLDDAIKLFSKSIELRPEDYYAWYNRGIAKSMLNRYEEALSDFEQTVKLAPEYKKGYLNRGNAKKHLTDYEGAIADYTYAIKLDGQYADAYFNRGFVYEMLGKKDSACADFAKAMELGMVDAKRKVVQCNDSAYRASKTIYITRLTKTSTDKSYGFTQQNPIKLGNGVEGGAANQRRYIELLRDAKGKGVSYKRLGSCCAYESANGFMGVGLLDMYELTYLDEKGKKRKAIIYISFYDYEEPMVIYGFFTIGGK